MIKCQRFEIVRLRRKVAQAHDVCLDDAKFVDFCARCRLRRVDQQFVLRFKVFRQVFWDLFAYRHVTERVFTRRNEDDPIFWLDDRFDLFVIDRGIFDDRHFIHHVHGRSRARSQPIQAQSKSEFCIWFFDVGSSLDDHISDLSFRIRIRSPGELLSR